MIPRTPLPPGQTESAEDWAPRVPSVWDVPEDDTDLSADESGDGDTDADPLAPPFPMPDPRPDWVDPKSWIAAEAGAVRTLAGAAESVGRLDERLRRAQEATRLAWRERLALMDVSELLWAEGVRLRPERLALADAGRIGRVEDDDGAIARARWASRRLRGQGALPASVEGLGMFLGRSPGRARGLEDDPGSGDSDWSDLPEALIPAGPDPRAAQHWIAAMATLGNAHPLTRSAAGFHLWRGTGLSAPGGWLEPGVVAARFAASACRGGLSAAPLLAGAERALAGQGGAGDRLKTWLTGLVRAAEHAQMTLDRVEAWELQALDQAAGMKGKGAPALIQLLAARPIVSARDTARALGVSRVQARTLLNRLQALGLVRELTGHTRFRFWAAAV